MGISNETKEFMEAKALKAGEHCGKKQNRNSFLATAHMTQAALGSWRACLELRAANCSLLGEFVFYERDLIAVIFKQIGK